MSDLEHALRDMLRERAADLQTTPDWLHDLGTVEPGRARGHAAGRPIGRALLVAAVIAVVVAISLGIAHFVGHHAAPPATRVTPVPSQQRSYCPATLPGSWPRTGAVVVPAADNPLFLAATPHGGIADRYDGTTRDVVLAQAGSVKRLFTVADPHTDEAIAASVDGNWAAITIGQYPWNNKFLPVELDLVNLQTGQRRVITRVSAADIRTRTNVPLGAGVVDGRVYWGIGTWPAETVKVQVYDIATGRVSTDPRSTAPGDRVTSAVQETAYGLTYHTQHGSVTIPRQLPAAVSAAVRHAGPMAQSTLVTDGSAYAWFESPDHLGWWQAGEPAVSVYREPYTSRPDGLLVAGPYLIYGARDGSTVITDARTGASARTPRNVVYKGAGGGVLFAQISFQRGISANEVTSLPELRCS